MKIRRQLHRQADGIPSFAFILMGIFNSIPVKMTASSEALPKLPVVVILGATATGKSKLAVHLANKFKGEVISADSMQVYKGLDILTNKVTEEEMKGIPHHLLSVIEPRQNFDITMFKKQALPLVEKILREGKIPFIVGGTNYYIESLLWEVLIGERKVKSNNSSSTHHEFMKRKLEDPISEEYSCNDVLRLFGASEGQTDESDLESYPSKTLHSALKLCDPGRASRLHPNDRRKIVRSLQVYFQTGRKHSQIIAEQRNLTKGWMEDADSVPHLGGPLRFENSFCFWIQVDKELLDQRIEVRVDEMVEKGLRAELDTYIDILKAKNSELDFTRGLLQSIGFKEFRSYLQFKPEERYSETGNLHFNVGKDLLKIATRQYAKKQLRWITQRFLQPEKRQVPPIYKLNGNLTNEEPWRQCVTDVADAILENHLIGNLAHPILSEKLVPTNETKDDHISRTCEVCDNRVFIGKLQWESHLHGRRHKKMKNRKAFSNNEEIPVDRCIKQN